MEQNPFLDAEIMVVGAGLAGAILANILSKEKDVLWIDSQSEASASTISMGIYAPIMSKKANVIYRHEEAFKALKVFLRENELTHLDKNEGMLKVVFDPKQIPYYLRASENYPEFASWISSSELSRRYPSLKHTGGGIWLPKAGAIPIRKLVRVLQSNNHISPLKQELLVAWNAEKGFVSVETNICKYKVKNLILALGYGFSKFPELSVLNLHPLKGQLIQLDVPTNNVEFPITSGDGYAVQTAEAWHFGSTFEHQFDTILPTPQQTEILLKKLKNLIDFEFTPTNVFAEAGVRITVPGTRQAMIGPLPKEENVWIFTGLGAKGLMTAPLFAYEMFDYLQKPDRIAPILLPTFRKR